MFKKSLFASLLTALLLVGLTGAAFAGEGDYPPLSDEMTSSASINNVKSNAANCGRVSVPQADSIQDCLSKCS